MLTYIDFLYKFKIAMVMLKRIIAESMDTNIFKAITYLVKMYQFTVP